MVKGEVIGILMMVFFHYVQLCRLIYSFWACLSISEVQRKKTDLEKLLWNCPSVSPDCSKRIGMQHPPLSPGS